MNHACSTQGKLPETQCLADSPLTTHLHLLIEAQLLPALPCGALTAGKPDIHMWLGHVTLHVSDLTH
jgi:hypothetical protein